MKRISILSLLLILLGSAGAWAEPVTAQLSPQESSLAYQQYLKRPKNELSKLIYLMDRFRGSAYKVVYNSQEYDSDISLQHAKNYIAKHYRNQEAVQWVRENSYRSGSGQVIYIVAPNGQKEILRDALTRELQTLPKAK